MNDCSLKSAYEDEVEFNVNVVIVVCCFESAAKSRGLSLRLEVCVRPFGVDVFEMRVIVSY